MTTAPIALPVGDVQDTSAASISTRSLVSLTVTVMLAEGLPADGGLLVGGARDDVGEGVLVRGRRRSPDRWLPAGSG
jgi:hypothetical protein